MKNVNFQLKQQPILISDIPSPASLLPFYPTDRITIQYHSQGRALQSQQKITRLAGEGCTGVKCYSSGTRLKERIPQGQIWKSQQPAVRHMRHKSTEIQGASLMLHPNLTQSHNSLLFLVFTVNWHQHLIRNPRLEKIIFTLQRSIPLLVMPSVLYFVLQFFIWILCSKFGLWPRQQELELLCVI